MTTPLPLNEAHSSTDASGHVQAHNDLAHYVNAGFGVQPPIIGTTMRAQEIGDIWQFSAGGGNEGKVWLGRIDLSLPILYTVTNFLTVVDTVGVGGAPANWFGGFYSSDGLTRLGLTAECHVALNVVGNRTVPLAAPFTIQGGIGNYLYAAFLAGVGYTTGHKFHRQGGNGFGSQYNFPTPRAFVSGSGQTALPSTVSLATAATNLGQFGAS